jgi:hypothetical protein
LLIEVIKAEADMLEIFGRSVGLSAPRATRAAAPACTVVAFCMIAALVPASSRAAGAAMAIAQDKTQSQSNVAEEFSSVERKASPRLQELEKNEKALEEKKDALEKDRVTPKEQREYRKTLLQLRNVEKLIDREKIRSGESRSQVFRERKQEEARERQKDAQERSDERNALIKKKEQEQSANRGGVLTNPDNQQPAGPRPVVTNPDNQPAGSKPVVTNPDNQKSAAPKPVINPDNQKPAGLRPVINRDSLKPVYGSNNNAAINRLTGGGTPINPDSRTSSGVPPTNTGAGKAAGGPAPMPPRPEPGRGRIN